MSELVSDLRLLLPLQGGEQELFIPAQFVKSTILPGVEHEVGHIVAAAHYAAVLIGIGVGFVQKPGRNGMFFQAVYGWEKDEVSKEVECVVKAAGPAADLIFHGRIDDAGASGDLADIELISGTRSLEPHLSQAKDILNRYRPEIVWLSARLRAALLNEQWRRMVPLPNGQMIALFIDRADLNECP